MARHDGETGAGDRVTNYAAAAFYHLVAFITDTVGKRLRTAELDILETSQARRARIAPHVSPTGVVVDRPDVPQTLPLTTDALGSGPANATGATAVESGMLSPVDPPTPRLAA